MKSLISFICCLILNGVIQAQVPQQVRAKKNTSVFDQTPAKKAATESATETNKKNEVIKALNLPSGYSTMRLKLPFATEEKDYQVQKTGHYFILNGDILVGDDFPKTLSYSTIQNSIIDFQWANGTLPIVIAPSIYENGLGGVVHDAINAFNNRTELCLVPRTNQDDYINIIFSPDLGTAAGVSKLGRQGGGQTLFLGPPATYGTVMHELMHAAGFYHEQCRSDRDQFVRIVEANMEADKKNQFQIEPGITQSTYDYCSIMHYSPTAFSKNGMPTIFCALNGLDVSCPSCIGNQSDFSDKDIQGIDNFYNKISRFPCRTSFPNPHPQMQFASTSPLAASQEAMATFRNRANMIATTMSHMAGAFPTFFERREGNNILGGTIFLKFSAAKWEDIPLSVLGNPSIDDFAARMRATQNYAVQNGYIGGFPTYHHVDNGKGIVCGTVLINSSAADWRDVPIGELGDPPLDNIKARMTSAHNYAVNHGYLGGFPTFHHADYGKGIVCGIILIKKESGEFRNVVVVEGPR
ncbi:MAG: M12 family metallopeptidase [Bacteroidota bacterium]